MNLPQRIRLLAWVVPGWVLAAGEPDQFPNLRQLQETAESGRYEHALRAAERNLERYPTDPRLIAFRARLVEKLAETNGDLRTAPAAAEPPAGFSARRSESGRNFTTETAEVPMVWIQPGSFVMCEPLDSDNRTEVTLTRGYWLGRTEVTQEQWQAVMEHLPTPSLFKGSDRPVERVAWLSAMEFCRKVNERERAAGRLPAGYEYSLPTEAQWEYACRAGTTGPHGGELERMAWFEATSDRQTHPVAQKEPNAWGLYDMHGNVREYCVDGYNGLPGGHVVDPMGGYEGPSAATQRIVRGGAWTDPAGVCRSAYRLWSVLNLSSSGSGFRLALAPVRTGAVEPAAGTDVR